MNDENVNHFHIPSFPLPHYPHFQMFTFLFQHYTALQCSAEIKMPLPEMTGGKPSRHAI